MFGGVMITLAWIINAYASSLLALYAAAMIAGIGAGSSMEPASAMPLSGFPTGGVLQPARRRRVSARVQRSPSFRSPT